MMHLPGLKVVAPATPADAQGLLAPRPLLVDIGGYDPSSTVAFSEPALALSGTRIFDDFRKV